MNFLVVCDTFYSDNNSASIQLTDLSESIANFHNVDVLTITYSKESNIFKYKGINVFKVPVLKTKNINKILRALNEIIMPFLMIYFIKKNDILKKNYDGIIWYSPSIFFGPLIKFLKKKYDAPSYLILRDIFPDWAVDMGLLKKGLVYSIFKFFEKYQYKQANCIGVQVDDNKNYLNNIMNNRGYSVELLNNWLTVSHEDTFKTSKILNHKIFKRNLKFIYAGNMGHAQDIETFTDVIKHFNEKDASVGFIFIGRGDLSKKIKNLSENSQINNLAYFDEINRNELALIYKHCNFGLVLLDKNHRTHNIPGKFISYIHYGLPIFAAINNNNDLKKIIENNNLGYSCINNRDEILSTMELLLNSHETVKYNNHTLAANEFSTNAARNKIINFFKNHER